MFFTDNLKYDIIGVAVALLVVYVAYAKWCFSYWKRKGLESLPASVPFGNATDLFLGRKSFGQLWQDLYVTFKSKGLKHGGAYVLLRPVYVATDLAIVKAILQTQFHNFQGHGGYLNEEHDPLSGHLFNLEGSKWKTTRTKLTPTFTSGKMKMMFQTLMACSTELLDALNNLSEKNAPVDTKNIMARFTTDIIGSCAFGLDLNSMKTGDSEFRKYGIKAISNDFEDIVRGIVQFVVPHSLLRFFNFKSINPQVTKFFFDLVEKTVSYREKHNISRNDFMHLLIQLKNKGKLADDEGVIQENGEKVAVTMSLNEIVAQSYVFFLAGFETSSTTINFAIYELCVNSDMQNKLRDEIDTVLKKYDNQLTYDAVTEMTNLDKIVQETLRKYPPVPELFRVCNKECRLLDMDVVIEKGTSVMISTLGIHYDPEYYPDPEKFDPERFSEENKAKRPNFTWLPFGEGPRICIGLRFGVLQTKIGLITLVKNFKLSLNKKTISPVVFDTGFVSSPKGGVWVDLQKLNNR